MPRIRIRTALMGIAFLALVLALVGQEYRARQRERQLHDELQAARLRAEATELEALVQARMAAQQVQLLQQTLSRTRAPAQPGKPAPGGP